MTDTSNLPEPRQRYYNNDGTVAAGCYLYTYEAGTTSPKTTYQDAAGATPHANPIVLDSKGEALIFWDGTYKVNLKTAGGVQITGYPVDNYTSYQQQGYPVLGTFVPGVGLGIRSITGVGFKPSRIEILATQTSTTKIVQCRTYVDSDGSCYSIVSGIDGNGSTMLIDRLDNYLVNMTDASGLTLYKSLFLSFDNDGFSFECTLNTTAPNIRYVAYP